MFTTRIPTLAALVVIGASLAAAPSALAQAGGGGGGGAGGGGGGGEFTSAAAHVLPNTTVPQLPRRGRALAGCSVRDMGRVDGIAGACLQP